MKSGLLEGSVTGEHEEHVEEGEDEIEHEREMHGHRVGVPPEHGELLEESEQEVRHALVHRVLLRLQGAHL